MKKCHAARLLRSGVEGAKGAVQARDVGSLFPRGHSTDAMLDAPDQLPRGLAPVPRDLLERVHSDIPLMVLPEHLADLVGL